MTSYANRRAERHAMRQRRENEKWQARNTRKRANSGKGTFMRRFHSTRRFLRRVNWPLVAGFIIGAVIMGYLKIRYGY